MAASWPLWRRKKVLLRKLITSHMQGPCDDAESVAHTIRPIEQVNLHLVLDDWVKREGRRGQLVGYTRETFFGNTGISQLLHDDVVQAPVQRQRISINADEEVDCVMRGLYLVYFQKKPITILLSHPEPRFEPPQLELLARDRKLAQEAMQQLLEETARHSVYKSKTILLEQDERGGMVRIRFQPLPPTPRDALVLPEQLLSVIERNVLGLLRHGDVLRRAGRSTRHGLLLHGPPGTGKTLMLRYLASNCPNHTVILLNGRQAGLIRESCQVARMLAPSLVLLEDVDLIGEDRSSNRCPVVLQDLMDEMDGLGQRAEVIFLLTTNRPEVLEPALSGRPGRIDQAIEFPLPDEDCRRRLFLLYGKGLEMSRLDLTRWIDKTRGVSPAFIEELLRKSALMAAERGESADPLPLTDADVEAAMEELICFGGELTQKLLGFRSFGFSTR